MTFGSLFAGIGGLDLGFERAGMKCVWQVEKDEYARRVLAKHWPNVPRWDDVKTFTGEGFERPDVICGGFPCQDISLAGRREGLAGERSGLWWEFARIIRLFRPRFVVVENVPGLLVPTDDGEQAAIGCVLGELASIGYDAEWQSIPASSFGSTQERFRVFIVAYLASKRIRPGGLSIIKWEGLPNTQGSSETSIGPSSIGENIKNNSVAKRGKRGQRTTEVRDESGERWSSSESDRFDSPFVGSGWWSTEPPLVRMVYGVPRGLVRHAIRGLGNAVVPQVAEYIGRRLMEISR